MLSVMTTSFLAFQLLSAPLNNHRQRIPLSQINKYMKLQHFAMQQNKHKDKTLVH